MTPSERMSATVVSGSCSTVSASAASAAHSCLIAQQDWDAVRRVLSTKQGRREIRAEMRSCALHFACRFHPPLDVVEFMSRAFPGSVAQMDKAGRSPLHIAARDGASPRVIQFLVDSRPDAASMQDEDGKTPLHHVCESYVKSYSSRRSGGLSLKVSMLGIVKALCEAAASSVNVEDVDGMTALEYAIESDVHFKVVRSIQKACEKDWKHRRELTPHAKHEEVEFDIFEESQKKTEATSKDLYEESMAGMNDSMSSLMDAMNSSMAELMNESMSNLKEGEKPKLVGSQQIAVGGMKPRKKVSPRALVA